MFPLRLEEAEKREFHEEVSVFELTHLPALSQASHHREPETPSDTHSEDDVL